MEEIQTKGLKGVIVNYRIGSKGRNPRWRQVILRFELPENMKPDMLIGKTVEIRWRGKVFRGKIYREHGKHAVRALFRRAPPGQILLGGYEVVIID